MDDSDDDGMETIDEEERKEDDKAEESDVELQSSRTEETDPMSMSNDDDLQRLLSDDEGDHESDSG